MNLKNFLIISSLTTIGLILLHKSMNPITAKPDKLRPCEAGKNYALKLLEFTVDHDISPGNLCNMVAKF